MTKSVFINELRLCVLLHFRLHHFTGTADRRCVLHMYKLKKICVKKQETAETSPLMCAGVCGVDVHCVYMSARLCQKRKQYTDPHWKRMNISFFPFRLIRTIHSHATAHQEQNGNSALLRRYAWLFICVSAGETGVLSPLWGYES